VPRSVIPDDYQHSLAFRSQPLTNPQTHKPTNLQTHKPTNPQTHCKYTVLTWLTGRPSTKRSSIWLVSSLSNP
jgi:hypothetical protein